MELRKLLTQVFTGSLSAQIELISTFQDFGYNIKLIKIEEEKKMLNVDKYREAIMGEDVDTNELDCHLAALRGIKDCGKFECDACMRESFRWLFSEYEPPLLENGDGLKPGDWIMVRDYDGDSWDKMMFACYCNGLFFVVDDNTLRVPGFRENGVNITGWRQARLPEGGE